MIPTKNEIYGVELSAEERLACESYLELARQCSGHDFLYHRARIKEGELVLSHHPFGELSTYRNYRLMLQDAIKELNKNRKPIACENFRKVRF